MWQGSTSVCVVDGATVSAHTSGRFITVCVPYLHTLLSACLVEVQGRVSSYLS